MSLTIVNLKRVCGIYCWIHRASGMCYVGSSKNISKRIAQHLRDARPNVGMTLINKAIREFGAAAFDVELLCKCVEAELPARERFYMSLLDADSINGFNIDKTPGTGTRGKRFSEASRERMRIAHKAMWTPEARECAAAAKRGTKRSPEALAKFKASMTGRRLTEETKLKISESHKGKKHTAESLEKMRAWKRKPMTQEQLEKHTAMNKARTPHQNSIAALRANCNRARTPEQIEKHSIAMTGYKWSPEALERRAEGVRKALCGKPRSEADRAKISAGWAKRRGTGVKRKPRSPEAEARRIEALKATHARKHAALMACEI